jgi:hypothetical protein
MDTTVPGTTQPALISTMPAGLPDGLPLTLTDESLDGVLGQPTTPAPAVSSLDATASPVHVDGLDPTAPVYAQPVETGTPSGWYVPPGFGENVLKMSSVEIYVVIIALALMVISASLIVALSK